MESVEQLNEILKDKNPQEILRFFIDKYKNKVVLSSSMGAEDQVLTDMISGMDESVRIFTLDTGRLFPETYELIDQTNKHYQIKVEIFFPDKEKVEKMVNEKGINLFYDSNLFRRYDYNCLCPSLCMPPCVLSFNVYCEISLKNVFYCGNTIFVSS